MFSLQPPQFLAHGVLLPASGYLLAPFARTACLFLFSFSACSPADPHPFPMMHMEGGPPDPPVGFSPVLWAATHSHTEETIWLLCVSVSLSLDLQVLSNSRVSLCGHSVKV